MATDPKCYIGNKYGVFTIVDLLEYKDKYSHYIYRGKCDVCGYEKCTTISGFKSKSKITTNCKHISIDGTYIKNVHWESERLRRVFQKMRDRCYNKNSKDYRWYGDKGIKVYEEWLNDPKQFEIWAFQNGYSDSLTIDRIDSNLDYSPENCRWISLNDNAKYKSTTSLIEVCGEVHTGKDWAKILGLGVNRINSYVRNYGLENTIGFIESCLKTPIEPSSNNQSYYKKYLELKQTSPEYD